MSTKVINKKLKNMFPEYRDLMQTLAEADSHFARLLHDHDDLDRQITHLERRASLFFCMPQALLKACREVPAERNNKAELLLYLQHHLCF